MPGGARGGFIVCVVSPQRERRTVAPPAAARESPQRESRTVAPPAAARAPVDLLLVLATDVSRSVDHAKFQLQREGYAAAISDKRVLDVDHRRAAMDASRSAIVEWSGASAQQRW